MGECKDRWPDDGPMNWLVRAHTGIYGLNHIGLSLPLIFHRRGCMPMNEGVRVMLSVWP